MAKSKRSGGRSSKSSARAGAKRSSRKAPPKKARAAKRAKRSATKRVAKSRKVATAKRRTAPKRATPAKRMTAAKRPTAAKRAAPVKRTSAKPSAPPAAAPARPKRAPTLDRARRTVTERDMVPSPPSSLDMDRSASAARTGRAELLDKLHEHTSTSPAMTAGDVDADWESAESVGDEAPGGDNPTPDQDVVDDIGKALGVEYDDDEELQGGDEIVERDKNRWELDPASSDDFDDRD
jgi:hypothetical protein